MISVTAKCLKYGLFVLLTAACAVIASAHAQPRSKPAAPPPQNVRNAAWWTDASRILGGLPMEAGSALGKLANLPPVQQHRDAFTRSWPPFENARLKPALKFGQEEIVPLAQSAGPVFYPFSGPDALYALALFPNASTFVLAGLEPVGEIPDLGALPEAELNASLADLRAAIASIQAFSFFRTREMRAQFSKNQFAGVTPILLLFIARHGFAVHRVDPLVLEPDATLRDTSPAARAPAEGSVPGVRITFARPGDKRLRTLYYFKSDLSDTGLAAAPQPLVWLANVSPRATYLKSASYLMHAQQFSRVRDFILDKPELVVQDDSGIPLRHFATESWDRAFFGSYDGPIRLFANRFQKDLLEAYSASAKPLAFGIGYDHQDKASNIQRFVRKRRGA
jgi:hypothetical protein